MAVLEAFVYDPLINWRLLKTNNEPKHDAAGAAAGDDGVDASGTAAPSGAALDDFKDNSSRLGAQFVISGSSGRRYTFTTRICRADN